MLHIFLSLIYFPHLIRKRILWPDSLTLFRRYANRQSIISSSGRRLKLSFQSFTTK